jgi:hypothetical protein
MFATSKDRAARPVFSLLRDPSVHAEHRSDAFRNRGGFRRLRATSAFNWVSQPRRSRWAVFGSWEVGNPWEMAPMFRCIIGSSPGLRHREAAVAHQRRGVDVATAKTAERFFGRDRVADAHDRRVQPLRDRFLVGTAGLGERLVGIRGQGVSPQIIVVAGGVAVAREDVPELRTRSSRTLR